MLQTRGADSERIRPEFLDEPKRNARHFTFIAPFAIMKANQKREKAMTIRELADKLFKAIGRKREKLVRVSVGAGRFFEVEALPSVPREWKLERVNGGASLSRLGLTLSEMGLSGDDGRLADTFRVRFPAGTVDAMMRYSGGTFETPFMEAGGIRAHARRDEGFFLSVLTLLTGQVTMARMEESLSRLLTGMEGVKRVLFDEKAAEIEALDTFTRYVLREYDTLLSNPDLRRSTLTTVQQNGIRLTALLRFHDRAVEGKLRALVTDGEELRKDYFTNKHRVETLKTGLTDVMEHLAWRQNALSLYAAGKAAEVRLAQIFDAHYLDDLSAHLEALRKDHCSVLSTVAGVMDELFAIKHIRENTPVGEVTQRAGWLRESMETMDAQIRALLDGFHALRDLDRDGAEFVYDRGVLYRLTAG